jgi:membrane fusion protein (multidrug efflux system)
VLLVGGIIFWNYAQTYESTDDAEVDCHLISVTPRIQGAVTAVNVEENQFVQQGQVLAVIDPRDFQVALNQAQASLTQTQADIAAQHPNIPIAQTTSESSVSTSQADVEAANATLASAEGDAAAAIARRAQAEAQLHEAEANDAKAQADLARYAGLVAKDEVAKTQFDQITASAKAQTAAVESARATVQQTQASADAAAKTVDQRRAQVASAQARLSEANRLGPQQVASARATLNSREAAAGAARSRVDKAHLDLSYTQIIAPVSGIVTKRTVEVGATVQPGQQLFSVAQIGDIWVTANFKETQLKRMRSGLSVDIPVDALGQTFKGIVESMPAATGAISSLLPPENATGNFVKVVQRLPARIRFDPNQQGLDRLRPGMSCEPKVWLQ